MVAAHLLQPLNYAIDTEICCRAAENPSDRTRRKEHYYSLEAITAIPCNSITSSHPSSRQAPLNTPDQF